jgi:hypothetical protein
MRCYLSVIKLHFSMKNLLKNTDLGATGIKYSLLGTSAVALTMAMGCNKNDEESGDKLIGEWEITDGGLGFFGGRRVEGGPSGTYSFRLVFHADGEMDYCYRLDFSRQEDGIKYCFFTEWEWVEKYRILAIVSDDFDEGESINITFDVLTGDSMEGELNGTVYDCYYDYEYYDFVCDYFPIEPRGFKAVKVK